MTAHDRIGDGAFVEVRHLGDATVAVVSEGESLWAPRYQVPQTEWRRYLPGADAAGRVWFGLNVVLVRLGAALVVIDPGLDDPGTALAREFGERFSSWGIEIVRSPGLAAAMVHLGWESAAVTHVVITHAHLDHYAGTVVAQSGALIPRFPHARHFVGRADWEGNPARAEPDSDLNRRLGTIAEKGLLEVVDGEREIAPGVTLVPSPGETPGHLAVRVTSAGRSLYVLGDLIHHACEVEHPDWVPGDRDGDAMRASRAAARAAVACRPRRGGGRPPRTVPGTEPGCRRWKGHPGAACALGRHPPTRRESENA